MNYQELLRKRDLYQSGRASIPELTLQSYEQAFEIEYTHNSTAIEGYPDPYGDKGAVRGWDYHRREEAEGDL